MCLYIESGYLVDNTCLGHGFWSTLTISVCSLVHLDHLHAEWLLTQWVNTHHILHCVFVFHALCRLWINWYFMWSHFLSSPGLSVILFIFFLVTFTTNSYPPSNSTVPFHRLCERLSQQSGPDSWLPPLASLPPFISRMEVSVHKLMYVSKIYT